jgi:hypothetical protein
LRPNIKLILPTVFGITKEDKPSTNHPLNAVQFFQAWSPQNNYDGAKWRIEQGIDDLKLQIGSAIQVSCELHPEAKHLAQLMHDASQNALADMCNWIDTFHLELKTTSQCTPEEAWHRVALCVKKVFEELHIPQAKAANATNLPSPTDRMSTYLWAMAQAHKIMTSFSAHCFRGHPSVAPVVMLHIFTTRATMSALDKAKDTIAKLSKCIKTLERLEARVAN